MSVHKRKTSSDELVLILFSEHELTGEALVALGAAGIEVQVRFLGALNGDELFLDREDASMEIDVLRADLHESHPRLFVVHNTHDTSRDLDEGNIF